MKATKMRIICGTDFSVHSAEAANVAAEPAKRLDETLILMVAEVKRLTGGGADVAINFSANARVVF